MMKTRNILLISAASVSLGTTIFFMVRRKRRSDLADEFFLALEDKLDPSVTSEKFNVNTTDPMNVTLNADIAKDIAGAIWDAWSWTGDDEDKVYSQLRLITTVDDFKYVSQRYMAISNGVALDIDLRSRLSEEEFKYEVLPIINNYQNVG